MDMLVLWKRTAPRLAELATLRLHQQPRVPQDSVKFLRAALAPKSPCMSSSQLALTAWEC